MKLSFFKAKDNTPKSKPKCIFVAGHPGSGKTMFGKRIAAARGFVFLDKDSLTGDMIEVAHSLHRNNTSRTINGGYIGDRESEFYGNWEFNCDWRIDDIMNETISSLSNKITLEVAEENLVLGNNVIISAPLIGYINTPRGLRAIEEMRLRLSDVSFRIIWIDTDRDDQEHFLRERNAVRDRWKLKNWNEYNNIAPYNADNIQGFNKDEIHIFRNHLRALGDIDAFNKLLDWVDNIK